MHQSTTATESRARSSGRSLSRGRNANPNELLARKQQLLSTGNLSAELASVWSADDKFESDGGHRRSHVRRAKQLEVAELGVGGDLRAKSVEKKLESLSELLKNHQINENLSATSSSKSIDDVYILLAKKEKDLQLAAELGKVLLEKNDELSKANERITEDYSHKLEVSCY